MVSRCDTGEASFCLCGVFREQQGSVLLEDKYFSWGSVAMAVGYRSYPPCSITGSLVEIPESNRKEPASALCVWKSHPSTQQA